MQENIQIITGKSFSSVYIIFRFQNNVFELIGYESNSYMRNTGEEEKVSINFSTNKVNTLLIHKQ